MYIMNIITCQVDQIKEQNDQEDIRDFEKSTYMGEIMDDNLVTSYISRIRLDLNFFEFSQKISNSDGPFVLTNFHHIQLLNK